MKNGSIFDVEIKAKTNIINPIVCRKQCFLSCTSLRTKKEGAVNKNPWRVALLLCPTSFVQRPPFSDPVQLLPGVLGVPPHSSILVAMLMSIPFPGPESGLPQPPELLNMLCKLSMPSQNVPDVPEGECLLWFPFQKQMHLAQFPCPCSMCFSPQQGEKLSARTCSVCSYTDPWIYGFKVFQGLSYKPSYFFSYTLF